MNEQDREQELKDTERLLETEDAPAHPDNPDLEDPEVEAHDKDFIDDQNEPLGDEAIEEMVENDDEEGLADVLERGASQSPPM